MVLKKMQIKVMLGGLRPKYRQQIQAVARPKIFSQFARNIKTEGKDNKWFSDCRAPIRVVFMPIPRSALSQKDIILQTI